MTINGGGSVTLEGGATQFTYTGPTTVSNGSKLILAGSATRRTVP